MNIARLLLVLLLAPAVSAQTEDIAGQGVATTPVRTGYFSVTLTPVDLLGEAGAATVAEIFNADEELVWQLYVPPTYDAAKPPGAIIYVSPRSGGGPPKAWNELLGERNLIWIGARNAGNDVPVARRMFLAMFGPMVLQRRYALDAERIYIAGISGGGKTASRVAALRPNMFKGGIFMSGALFWDDATPPLLDMIRGLRYVFLSGSEDPALNETRRVQRRFVAAGVENSKLIIVRDHGHRLPDAMYFARAIDYLDGNDAD
ncbi:MAG: hypothetical protein R3288_12100 [Woeseiaceae bacterium]|nr:hypothetical protein [Woeseiaceae bacterium]